MASESSPLLEHMLDEVVRTLGRRPDLAAELRAHLGVPEAPPQQLPRAMKVAEYAAHLGFCKRTVEKLIEEGLPIEGEGHRRRVPVAEADAWFKNGGAAAVLERRAQLDARRHVRKAMAAAGSTPTPGKSNV